MPEFERSANYFVLFAVSAGIAALLLLPLGQLSLSSVAFNVLWATHLALQAAAVACSLQLFIRLNYKLGQVGKFLGLSILLLLFALISTRALLPVSAKDALIYHLAVPKLWLQSGRVHEIEWHEWSYFPMLLGLVQSGFLNRGLEVLCAFYHFSFLFLTCAALMLAIFQISNSARAATLGYLICFSLPLFVKLGAEPMADLAVCAYISLAFLCTLNYVHNQSTAMVICAALGLGLALCAKYSSILSVAIFFLCLPFWFEVKKLGVRELLRVFLTQGIIVALMFSPWLFRNYSWTGNPFYPFLQGFFAEAGYNRAFIGGVNPITHRALVYGESLWEIILLPLRIFIQGQDDNPRLFDGVASPLLLLAFVSYWRLGKASWHKFILLFGLIHIILSVLLFHALLRYQAPVLTLLIVPCAIYLGELEQSSSTSLRYLSRILLTAHFVFALAYAVVLNFQDNSWSYLFSGQSREQYLEAKIAEYSSASFINSNLPADAGIYLLFTGNRYYYYERRVYGSYFSGDLIIEALNNSPDPSTLIKLFAGMRVQYLLLHQGRTKSAFEAKLSPQAMNTWQEFIKNNLEPIHKQGLYFLGRIK